MRVPTPVRTALHVVRDRSPDLGSLRNASAALALALPLVAEPGPRVLEPVATITVPDATFTSMEDVAIDGSHVILAASKRVPDPEGGRAFSVQAAFLFARNAAGAWTFVRKLVEAGQDPDFETPIRVAMDDGIAAVNLFGGFPQGSLHVFERTAADWVGVPAQGRPEGTDVEINAGSIVVSDGTCNWDGQVFRKNAAGTWVQTRQLHGVFRGCDDEFRGGDIDISGTTVIVPQPMTDDADYLPSVFVFEGVDVPTPATLVENPDGPGQSFGWSAAIEKNTLAVSGTDISGTYLFRRESPGNWVRQPNIRPADTLMAGFAWSMEMEDGFLLQARAGGTSVFRCNASGAFDYVAQLDGVDRADMSGRHVVAIGGDGARVFYLPAKFSQPASRQDNFQDGNANGWAPQAGSAFAVVSTPTSRVYRQTSLTGTAASVLTNTDWTDQSIQAEIKPTAFDGADRWFGLAVRYTDASNYYYVTARSTNVVQLRRIVNGAFQPLASVPLPVTTNRTYALRLEAIGTLLRLYVDGKLALEVRDSSLRRGQAALIMHRTRADYDNVIVSPNRLTTLVADTFESGSTRLWTPEAGVWSVISDGTKVYAQTSIADTARSVTGITTRDQIVQMRAKATAFATGNERWFGAMVRFRDSANYYYVTVRSNNTISLRKLVNGSIHVLDSAPLNVRTGTWYTLRLEAIGKSLRGYVNGNLLLEADDSSFPTGSYGAVTFKTATRYDDFAAVQP